MIFLMIPLLLAGYTDVAVATGEAKPGQHRSPVDLDQTTDGQWIVTANETSDSVSLIRVKDRTVVAEFPVGRHPVDIEICGDDRTVVVSCSWSGELYVLSIRDNKLAGQQVIQVGHEPSGIAVTSDGSRAFVGLVATGQVAEVDLAAAQVVRRIDVGSWPRYLTLAPDESRLSVGCSGDSNIYVVDAKSGEVLYDEPLANGINIGHMFPSADGQYAYFTWMVYRTNPITVSNLKRGWLLASRIGRVRFDGPQYREAISLDVPGIAVADPHGIAVTPNGRHLVASAAGTHELLVYRLADLPFVGIGGPGDLIDRRLQNDRDRFHRIETGGRPMGLQISSDSNSVFVANYLKNSIQVVDLVSGQVSGEIDLGGPDEPSLARKGMEIFYDGRRSMDQWYSCHSCHQDGGVNSRPVDTWNDGTEMTLKTILPLFDVTRTGPWTWHGWQEDLSDAMHKSLTSTMLGKAPKAEETQALLTYLDSLQQPPNPFRKPDGSLTEQALRGKAVFESQRAGCANCHNGPYFTDGRIHDVGLGSENDHYEGYNTPSLRGVYRKVRLLHTGRARDLQRVITDLHSPEKVSGSAILTEAETQDLIAYLKSL